jgi:drug/metabolite transporter (DMT)-like permease
VISREDRIAIASFVGSGVLAGGNAVAIRFSNRELAPLWGASLRFVLAASLLLLIAMLLRLPFPRGEARLGAILYGLFNFGGAFALAYYALLRLHAGFGQTLLALVPLVTLLLAVLHGQEHLRPASVVGTLLAVAGVGVMSGPSLGEAIPLLTLLAALGSVLCFAEAPVLVRRFPRVHPLTMNAVGMTAAAVFLLLASVLAGESHALPRRAATLTALAYIAVIGSVVVFSLFLVVLRYWAASRAAYVLVIVPFITVPLSTWLDNEPVGLELILGGLLVLAGVYVGALRPARLARRPVEADRPE